MVATIRLPLRNALNMQQRAIVNPTNVITEWQLGDHITIYNTPGIVVYTYFENEYAFWRRTDTTTGFVRDTPPYMDDGTFWEEISLGGGNITVAPTPPADPDPGDLWLDGGSGITYVWNMSTIGEPPNTTEVTQWIQTGGIGQPSPAEGFITTTSGDARYVQQSGANYSTEIQTSIRNEIGAINTQFQDSTGTNQDLAEITFNTDGDEITFTDGTNSRTFSGGTNADAVNMLIDTAIAGNVWNYTAGAYYAVGDVIADQRIDGSIQFYELSGTDITNAPATFTEAQALDGVTLTLRDTELENNRIAITYARNFFTPPPDGSTEILRQGQILHSNEKLWIARASGDQTLIGMPGYDNLANWRPLADVETRDDDPTGDNLQQGRFWYNSSEPTTDDPRQPGLRYYDGSRVHSILSSDQLANLISTDLDAQRLEHHQNTCLLYTSPSPRDS